MRNKKYNYSVVIGRFQPVHNAHMTLFRKGLELAEKLIIVLGSANSPRTIKNPWTAHDREEMILSALTLEERVKVRFVHVEDVLYSDSEWVANVYSGVDAIAKDQSVVLVAHEKDETSYYVNYFKNYWKLHLVDRVATSIDGPSMSSTKLRELYFEGYMDFLDAVCPKSVTELLRDWSTGQLYKDLKKEYDDAVAYDAKFENVPYGQTNFVTVDAMVVQSGHVLLIRRKHSPGKGLWALPGGHLNVNETFLEGAIRELKEETGIKVPDKVLRGSIVYSHVFDHPDRSLRGRVKKKIGRTITQLFVFKLDDSIELPKVKASDDAAEAWWFTFGEIKNMRDQLFEDHFDMLIHGLTRV